MVIVAAACNNSGEVNPDKIRCEPQQWNRYSYVVNNPLKYTDPDGRDKFMAWFFGQNSQYADLNTWQVLKMAFTGQHAGDSLSAGAREFAEDHRASTGRLSPVPTTKGEVAIAPVFMMLGPAGGAARTTLAEAKMLVGAWGKGTFSTLAKTIGHQRLRSSPFLGAIFQALSASRHMGGVITHPRVRVTPSPHVIPASDAGEGVMTRQPPLPVILRKLRMTGAGGAAWPAFSRRSGRRVGAPRG